MGHSRSLFLYFCLFYLNVQLVDKNLPMLGFEPQISAKGNYHSTNWATTTAQERPSLQRTLMETVQVLRVLVSRLSTSQRDLKTNENKKHICAIDKIKLAAVDSITKLTKTEENRVSAIWIELEKSGGRWQGIELRRCKNKFTPHELFFSGLRF